MQAYGLLSERGRLVPPGQHLIGVDCVEPRIRVLEKR